MKTSFSPVLPKVLQFALLSSVLSLGSLSGTSLTPLGTANPGAARQAVDTQAQGSDDRGSGRIFAEAAGFQTPDQSLALRGSGRLDPEPEAVSAHTPSPALADILVAYRGSGRIGTDPQTLPRG